MDHLHRLKILQPTTKAKEFDQNYRKGLLDLYQFVFLVQEWQEERPPLLQADSDFDLLVILILGELEEVGEHKQIEGAPKYDFKSEEGETIDLIFFLAAMTHITGNSIDLNRAIQRANGQASGSNALDLMGEIIGNMSEKSLQKDLEYVWTLLVSYLIHMKFPVNPNQVLEEYTMRKNNGNYPKELLQDNPLFRVAHQGREMDVDEKQAYFIHFRKAMRLIRDFIIKHVDKEVEDTGLRSEHYLRYSYLIYNFMSFSGTGLNSQKALQQLEEQLYIDYDIERSGEPQILRLNKKLPN